MHLGIYHFAGDPKELRAAYDRLLAGMPTGQITLHICAVRPDGITIYDTCPSEEAFRNFSSNPALQEAFAAAGLPEPEISGLPVHAAWVDGEAYRRPADG